MIWLVLRRSGHALGGFPTWADLFATGYPIGWVGMVQGFIHVGTDARADADLRQGRRRGDLTPPDPDVLGWGRLQ